MDEDAIEKLLEPGEKLVWSDRPHGLLSALRRLAAEEPRALAVVLVTIAFTRGSR